MAAGNCIWKKNRLSYVCLNVAGSFFAALHHFLILVNGKISVLKGVKCDIVSTRFDDILHIARSTFQAVYYAISFIFYIGLDVSGIL